MLKHKNVLKYKDMLKYKNMLKYKICQKKEHLLTLSKRLQIAPI